MDTKNICEEQWTRWKGKRRNTLIGYIIVGAMVGIDYGFMLTTLYLYLKDMIKSEYPELFYGMIISAYNLSSMLFGVVSGRWVDRTRRVKLYITLILILQLIGCLLYAIPFHVVFLFSGRVIAGIGDPVTSVTSGEIIRIFNKKEGTRALWWLASSYSIGFMVGPGIVLFFKKVDFYLWGIHLTQLNIISLFMACLLLLTLIPVNFLIHDCSAEMDLKEYLQGSVTYERMEQRSRNASESTTDENILLGFSTSNTVFYTVPIKDILGKLYRNVDALLLFVSTFVLVYCLYSCDVIIPLLTEDVLHWSLTALTIFFVANGVIYFMLLMYMSKYCTGDSAVYRMSLICIIALILMLLIMAALKVLARNLTRDMILMIFFVILWAVSWVIEEVLIRSMLAKLVPSHCQSFTETIRNSVSRLGTTVAAVTSPLVIPFLQWWTTGLIITVLILLLGFVIRRRYLCNIREIDFDKYRRLALL